MSKISKTVKKIDVFSEVEYSIPLNTDKDKIKLIKRIEQIVRSSMEYRDYVKFLKTNIDMTKCAFFNKISNADNNKIKIEIHHEPFTLFNIVRVVLNKWLDSGIPLNDLYISDEVMDLHYRNMVGLVPLSRTIHELCHNNSDMTIPLYLVYGDYSKFVDEYGDYMENDLFELLEKKISKTKSIDENSFDIIRPEFIYLDTTGVQPVAKFIEERNVAV